MPASLTDEMTKLVGRKAGVAPAGTVPRVWIRLVAAHARADYTGVCNGSELGTDFSDRAVR